MVRNKVGVFNSHMSLSFKHHECGYAMELAGEYDVDHLKHVMSETKLKVHLYLSVVGEEVEEQSVVKSQFIGAKSSRGRGDRQFGGKRRGNDIGVGYEKKTSVADKFVSDNDNYLILMINYLMKNQMKVGRKMSTCNGKLLLITDIVFLLFLIVHNLFLNLDHFTLKKSFRLRFKNQANLDTRLFVCKKNVIGVYMQLSLKELKCLKLRLLIRSTHVLHNLYTQIIGKQLVKLWEP
uniref:Uncharacterized protein n=1 Tax=Lactuca sativa TaxID=4236 RepID=A0A9R1XI92_LACSA|nr:hypothetical protein LSAT_V11C400194430 [Lactuca sativa]